MEPEKKPVRVTIFHQQYTLLAANPAQAESLAQKVDDLMQEIADKGGYSIDATRAAVLACLHLADELQTAERQLAEYRHQVEQKTNMYRVLLDGVIG
jgi:cell division protein ZapA (FtsZ GTPase activity inhibitor)